MRLKSYFANTVEAALSMARQELGPEALLMKSGPAIPEARYLGTYEVVFAAPESAGEAEPPPKPARAEAGSSQALEKLMQDVAELRKQLERTTSAVAKANRYPATLGVADPAVQETIGRLREADISAESISRIVDRTLGRTGRPACSLEDAVAADITACPEIRTTRTGRKIVAMVGPPGAGKTTTLVKLAVAQGLKCRRPVQVLTADLYRIAAAEQLRSYAAILGVGFQTAETAVLLCQQMEEHRQKDLILIDTPGYGVREMDAALDLAAFLGSHSEIDVHLVLTATTKTADLIAAADRYAIFRPSKLVFTRCDETESFGQIIDLCFHTGLPVSFLGTGQQIPEDFEPAENSRLTRMVLGEREEPRSEERARAAA